MNSGVEHSPRRCVVSERCVEDRKTAREQKLKGLLNHHSRCEINYHRCLALIPGYRTGTNHWVLSFGGGDSGGTSKVTLKLLELAPYTTTLELYKDFGDTPSVYGQYLQPSRLKLRLYHDAGMAEVVAWGKHRHWQPVYEYPNKGMYQPDEKMVLNQFLGELLYHCRYLGAVQDGVCESIRINKN